MICLARKTPKDGKEENIRVRVTPEQKQEMVKAMQENGLWNFSWSVLELCPSAELNERESFYIDLFNSYNYGYNQNQGIRKS